MSWQQIQSQQPLFQSQQPLITEDPFSGLPTMKQLNKHPSISDLGLFNLDTASDVNMGNSLSQQSIRTNITPLINLLKLLIRTHKRDIVWIKIFQCYIINARSLKCYLENLQTHPLRYLDYNFNV